MNDRRTCWVGHAVVIMALVTGLGGGCDDGSDPDPNWETPPFETPPDLVAGGALTIDLDIDSNNDGIIEPGPGPEDDAEGTPEKFHETIPTYQRHVLAGKCVKLNNNDTWPTPSGNLIPDSQDTILDPSADKADMAQMELRVQVPDDYEPAKRALMLGVDHTPIAAGNYVNIYVDSDPGAPEAYEKLQFMEEFKEPPPPEPHHTPPTRAEVTKDGLKHRWFSGKGDVLFRIGSRNDHAEVPIPATYDPGVWTHVACTFDGGTAKVYVGGIEEGSMVGIGQTVSDSVTPLRLGKGAALAARGQETHEAENAVNSNCDPGTQDGIGYLSPKDGTSWIEWTIDALAGVEHNLEFRYALGEADRTMELKVNGAVVDPNLTFPSTLDWAVWGAVNASATLNVGNNTVRLTGYGPYIDCLSFSPMVPVAEAFSGCLDDVRIYDQALATTDIETLAARGEPATQPVAHWMLDEVGGATADDATAADGAVDEYDGTLENFRTDNLQWVSGEIGGALEFDPSADDQAEDFVTCGTTPGSASALTVAFWMKADGLGLQTAVDKCPDDAAGIGWSVKLRRSMGLANFLVEGVKPGRLGLAALDREVDENDVNYDWVWATVTGVNLLEPTVGAYIPIGLNAPPTTISWECFGFVDDNTYTDVTVEYSLDGITYESLLQTVRMNRYDYSDTDRNFQDSWTWANVSVSYLGNQCWIRVSMPNPKQNPHMPDPTLWDESEASFLFTGIRVVSPNGGEVFDVGESTTISWRSYGVTSVKIWVSRDGKANWEPYQGNGMVDVPGDGLNSVPWSIPDTWEGSTDCYIRISDEDGDTYLNQPDDSDQSFRIRSIELVSPNGGEMFHWSGNVTISWRAAGFDNDEIRLLCYPDYADPATFVTICQVPAVDGKWEWQPSGSLAAGNYLRCRIEIHAADRPSLEDESNSDFAIVNYHMFTRDDTYTLPISDWPEVPVDFQLRSPKFIFGRYNYLYLRYVPEGPVGTGVNVRVTGESDAIGQTIQLIELGAGSGVYGNVGSTGNRLRLDAANRQDATTKYVKIVDEDILTLDFKVDGITEFIGRVMVDRGEVASASAGSNEVSYPGWTDYHDVTYFQPHANGMAMAAQSTLDWDEHSSISGYLLRQDPAYTIYTANAAVEAFILSGGSGEGECDLMCTSSHGSTTGYLSGLYMHWNTMQQRWEFDEVRVFSPGSVTEAHWSEDVDWVLPWACNAVNPTSGFIGTLTRPSRPPHGVLGFDEEVLLTAYAIGNFFGELVMEADGSGQTRTVLDAWITACTAVNSPWAALYHPEHANDRLCPPTPLMLPGVDDYNLGADVTTTDIAYTYHGQASASLYGPSTSIGEHREDVENLTTVVAHGERAEEVLVPVVGAARRIPGVSCVPHRFLLGEWNAGPAARVLKDETGGISISRLLDFAANNMTVDQARGIAEALIADGLLPADAEIVDFAPLCHQINDEEPRVVAYTLTLRHRIADVIIAGDVLRMIVQVDGLKFMTGVWHDVSLMEADWSAPKPFDVNALSACVAKLRSRLRPTAEMPRPVVARPVYYVGDMDSPEGRRAHVVWEVCFEGGLSELWDPDGRHVLDPAADFYRRLHGLISGAMREGPVEEETEGP